MTHSVRRHLGVEIAAYDATIRRFIPGYEAMLRAAADAVALAGPGTVVDLGAGTGALSEAVLERAGSCVVELWDVDPEMLAGARRRLSRFGERARYRERSFLEPLPACDAAMASLALHHIASLDEKGALYARIAAALPPSGVLVNADAALPAGDDGFAAAFRAWADHQVASGIPEPEAWANFEAWALEDTYFSIDEETGALERAGLRTDCVWREGPIAVLVGRKG